jgi:uncharacterized protein YbcV (DUF1398 family)
MPPFLRVIRWRRSEARTEMPRLNKKRVEEIFTRSKQEKWAYPKIFDALKDAGVEYYETNVATHDDVYHGWGDSIPEPPPQEFIPLKPGASFDAAGVKLAIERNKTNLDYMVFLKEIARAGVVRYRVDMSARDVTYLGAAGQAYVEKVPPVLNLAATETANFLR